MVDFGWDAPVGEATPAEEPAWDAPRAPEPRAALAFEPEPERDPEPAAAFDWDLGSGVAPEPGSARGEVPDWFTPAESVDPGTTRLIEAPAPAPSPRPRRPTPSPISSSRPASARAPPSAVP